MPGKPYTEEQTEFLLSRCEDMTGQELTDLFNQTFSENKKRKAILDFIVRQGKHCKMPTSWGCKFTKEQEEFIHKNAPTMYRRILVDALNKAFGTNFPYTTVKSYCVRHKLTAPGGDGKFTSDSANWQRGLSKEEFKAHYSEESFKKMTSPMLESNRIHKIGDVVIRHDRKYIYINEDYGKPINQRIQEYGRYLWEQVNGPIPDGFMIVYLDGDYMNCTIDNLICVPKKYRAFLMHNSWWNSPAEIKAAALKWCELYYALKEAE